MPIQTIEALNAAIKDTNPEKLNFHFTVLNNIALRNLYQALSEIEGRVQFASFKLELRENNELSPYVVSFFAKLIEKTRKWLCIEQLELVNLILQAGEWRSLFLSVLQNIRNLKTVGFEGANFDDAPDENLLTLAWFIRAQSDVTTLEIFTKPKDDGLDKMSAKIKEKDEALRLALNHNPKLTSFAYGTKSNPGSLGDNFSEGLELNAEGRRYIEGNIEGNRADTWYSSLKDAFLRQILPETDASKQFQKMLGEYRQEYNETFSRFHGTPVDKHSWVPLERVLNFFELQETLRCHFDELRSMDETNQDKAVLTKFADDFVKCWPDLLNNPDRLALAIDNQIQWCEQNASRLQDQKTRTWLKNALLIFGSLLLLGTPLLFNRYKSGHFLFKSDNQHRLLAIKHTLQQINESQQTSGSLLDKNKAESYQHVADIKFPS